MNGILETWHIYEYSFWNVHDIYLRIKEAGPSCASKSDYVLLTAHFELLFLEAQNWNILSSGWLPYICVCDYFQINFS